MAVEPHRIELNIDLGELPDEPEELYSLATRVNIACGGHAGDDASMRHALMLAKRHGAKIAAHPSYPDRAGFGRNPKFCSVEETARAVEAQCAKLRALGEEQAIAIDALKPHGALYHDANADDVMAAAIVDAALRALPSLTTMVGAPNTRFEHACRARGLAFLREGFADRRYDDAGHLVPRSKPNALLTDPAACVDQALRLAREGRYDTLCAHGDTAGSLGIARAVRAALDAEGLLAS
ncbi:MAG: LamB/YcsF family protein [Polyangiaceae bacterium]|nr:LamB/YcsF family protein [Polyangiaceae bacterium]